MTTEPIYNKTMLKKINEYRDKLGISLGEKIDIEFPMDVEDRAITYGRKKRILWKKITEDLQDSVSNTTQYVKLVNSYLKIKKSQIEKIIELTNKFDQEIHDLHLDNTKILKLNKIPIHEINSQELKQLAQILIRDKKQRQENLQKLKNEIIEAEEKLVESEKRIERLDSQILDKKLKHNS